MEEIIVEATDFIGSYYSVQNEPSPPPPYCVFYKNVSSRKRGKPWFFMTFNIIISHIFPENFIEISQVDQKI